MGLLQNIRVLNAEPIKLGAGGTAGSVPSTSCMDRVCFFNRPETYMNKYAGFAGLDPKGGVPYGYSPPSQLEMPVKDGGMSTFSGVDGSGEISTTSSMNKGINLLSSASGWGTIPDIVTAISPFLAFVNSHHTGIGSISSPAMDIISVLVTNLFGNGTISTAQAILLSKLEASLPGSGTITFADLLMLSVVVCEAAVSGSGTISSSDLNLPISAASNLVGNGVISTADLDSMLVMMSSISSSGTITQAQINTFSLFLTNALGAGTLAAIGRATCEMSCDMTSAGEMVTAQSCAQAVWSAIAAAFNEAGTMGNKMNSASAAGDPWTAEIPGGYAEGSAGAIIEKIRKIVNDNQALILSK